VVLFPIVLGYTQTYPRATETLDSRDTPE